MTGAIDPGRLRHRLMLRAPIETPDGSGGFSIAWQDQFECWASIRPLVESTLELAGNRDVGVSHEIIVRKRTGIIPGARFALGARVFDILGAFDPDETGRYLQCRCRESL
jgi:SPP1 family predicted phage head-tail adaptor